MARAVWATPVHVPGHHQQRVNDAALGRFQALEQVVLANSFIRKPTVPLFMP